MDEVSKPGWLEIIGQKFRLDEVAPGTRRVVVGVIGGTVLVIGVALIILPGPAFIVIPLGLAILATEFVWAKRWLDKAKKMMPKKKKSETDTAENKTGELL